MPEIRKEPANGYFSQIIHIAEYACVVKHRDTHMWEIEWCDGTKHQKFFSLEEALGHINVPLSAILNYFPELIMDETIHKPKYTEIMEL